MPRVFPILLAAIVFAATAAGAAPRLLVAGSDESPLRLRLDGGTARLETSNGGVTSLAIPPGGNVDHFTTTRRGWLAVGSVPVTGGRELAIWASDVSGSGSGSASPAMAPPPGRVSAVRASPVPLLDGGELVGLAWLEGEAADRFGVWASGWDGRRWSAPKVVAPPGPGSQLALGGAVLADGSWLLAWSAFDGEDDEVLWSRRGQGRTSRERWSQPRPVAAGNQVPDVTPALRADGDGAVLAWSRYDGNDYRLVLARFSAGRWQAADWAAEAGTILPAWQGETLTFRDAAHGAWVAARIDAADRLHAAATAAAPPEPRPAVAREAGVLRLLFP